MASKIDPRLRDDDGAETPAIRTSKSMTEPAETKAHNADVTGQDQTTESPSVKFSELQARYG
ncbi:MAG: hypothetical protein KUG74_10390 [Rhodobacteraceae bacterium]|nr:hypothetical protein [Paracoccaceae bacterium]